MAEISFSLKNKQKSFCNAVRDSEYSNLNLNQTQKCSAINSAKTVSSSNQIKAKKYQGCSLRIYLRDLRIRVQESEKIFANHFRLQPSLKKFENGFKSNFKHQIDEEKGNKKICNSNVNGSTLSLHIAAYENFIEVSDDDKDEPDFCQKAKNVKQSFTGSTTMIENSLEFPRQQKEETSKPEVMQFKASQQLYHPENKNEVPKLPSATPASSNLKGYMGYNRKERLKIASKLGKQRNEKNRPTNNTISWRLKNLQHKSKKEERTLQEHEELYQSRNNEHKEEEAMDAVETEAKVEEVQSYNQKKGYSLSVAVPGSILNNAQGPELKTYLAGQIARTCAVFCVDEVVIFDESARMTDNQIEAYYSGAWVGMENINPKNVECNFHMARILEYLECPQYLRKYLFPMQRPLNFSGVLNPLDGMHHLRADNFTIPYREGIVLDKPVKDPKRVLCDVGLDKELELEADYPIPPKTRVTVKMSEKTTPKRFFGSVSSPKAIMKDLGIYWGYNVRIAKSLSEAMNNYDIIIGTSERGTAIRDTNIPPVKNQRVMVVFGGLQGLESALDADEEINETDPSKIFPIYVNSLPGQGSRIIRTEEAIPITLSLLRDKLENV